MRIYIILLFIGIASCATVPESKTYKINMVIVESAEDVVRICDIDSAKACAFPNQNPCQIIMSKYDWEQYVRHEVAHCLQVLTHD